MVATRRTRGSVAVLPQKRETEDDLGEHELSPSPKKSKSKSKSELRRQSLSNAQKWASDRKRKSSAKDSADDEGVKKSKSKRSTVKKVEEETHDVVEDLQTRKSSRRRGKSKVVAAALAANSSDTDDDASSEVTDAIIPLAANEPAVVNTRNKSARRSSAVTAKKAPAPKRRGGRKTITPPPPAVEEEEAATPEIEEEKVEVVAAEEDVKKVVQEETGVLKEVLVAEAESTPQAEDTEQETAEVVEAKTTELKKTSVSSLLFSLAPVFFQGLIIQWTLAYAVILTFCYDWWVFQGTGNVVMDTTQTEDMMESQRMTCAILGTWLITIAGYSVVFGARSRVGSIMTCAVLIMVSFSTNLMASSSGTSVPSLPIYSVSGFDINVPDSLAVMSLLGCIVNLLQPVAPLV